MALIIIGLILFFAALAINKQDGLASKFIGPLRIGSLLLVLLGISTSCIKKIDAGPIGVKSMFGTIARFLYHLTDRCVCGHQNCGGICAIQCITSVDRS